MGLRERNAMRARELILDTALPLFLKQGYDATTMEEIAEGAQIGTSTLYRYFPSKDLLLIEPLGMHGEMAAELLSRPVDEPLDVALGHAVRRLIVTPRANPVRMRQITEVVSSSGALRGRLIGEFFKERHLLEQAVAERTGRPVGDLFCVITARLATVVLEMVVEPRPGDPIDDPELAVRDALERMRRIMDQLGAEPPVLPRLESDNPRA